MTTRNPLGSVARVTSSRPVATGGTEGTAAGEEVATGADGPGAGTGDPGLEAGGGPEAPSKMHAAENAAHRCKGGKVKQSSSWKRPGNVVRARCRDPVEYPFNLYSPLTENVTFGYQA